MGDRVGGCSIQRYPVHLLYSAKLLTYSACHYNSDIQRGGNGSSERRLDSNLRAPSEYQKSGMLPERFSISLPGGQDLARRQLNDYNRRDPLD